MGVHSMQILWRNQVALQRHLLGLINPEVILFTDRMPCLDVNLEGLHRHSVELKRRPSYMYLRRAY